MKKPDLSIIILSYNTKKLTKDCLLSIKNSLKNSKITVEIIVLDNASKDGSVEMLQELQKEFNKNVFLRPIFSEENLGYAKGNNFAAKKAKSDYLLFLNSDTLVLNNALEKLLQFYKQNEAKYQFVGPRLLNPDKTPQASVGKYYSLINVFLALFLKGDYFGLTRSSPNKITEADWISGACFLTKKKYFEDLNGFDEKIFMYMDEVEFFLRARKKGYKIGFYPEAKIMHLEFGSSPSKIKRSQPIIRVFEGLLYLYKKHHPKWQLQVLKFLLKLKSQISIIIGKITNNKYLIETYGKTYQILKKA